MTHKSPERAPSYGELIADACEGLTAAARALETLAAKFAADALGQPDIGHNRVVTYLKGLASAATVARIAVLTLRATVHNFAS